MKNTQTSALTIKESLFSLSVDLDTSLLSAIILFLLNCSYESLFDNEGT